MSCKDKDGGTHHFACDCREASFKALESQRDALKAEVDAFDKERTWLKTGWDKASFEVAALQREVEKLKAQIGVLITSEREAEADRERYRTLCEGLAEAGRELLSGHDNLYVAHWPRLSPLNDIAAKPMREALTAYAAQKEK
jgi:predicted RNase H-like nuclease (RuvC/YqgF family)